MKYISGSNITLSCSCESKPPASFQWSYNGISLHVNSPTLQLTKATQNQTGAYACIAQNGVTLRYATATRSMSILGELKILNSNLCFLAGYLNSSRYNRESSQPCRKDYIYNLYYHIPYFYRPSICRSDCACWWTTNIQQFICPDLWHHGTCGLCLLDKR